jgi:polyisoprenoid-binding protein YceI
VRLAAHAIDAAHARVDVRALTVGGTHKPQLATALATRVYPFATFDLGGPVALDPSFASGGEVSTTARGMLTVRGVSRGVTFALKARLNGTMIDLLGTARLVLARWGVKPPAGFGPLGSLAGEARAEFLVLLSRSARGA